MGIKRLIDSPGCLLEIKIIQKRKIINIIQQLIVLDQEVEKVQ